MKKYIYVFIDSDKNIILSYDNLDLAEKMKPHVEKKLNLTLEIVKVIVNPDLAHLQWII